MALFDFLKKQPKLPTLELSVLRTDMHSHFIPGIDDGAKDMEDSLAMLKGMQELGYKKVITTPHIMTDGYRNTPEIILSGLEKVKQAAKEAGIDIEIEAAAEYYLDYEFEKKLKDGNVLTFGAKYLLWEIPFINPPDNINDIVFEMASRGYRPILAHVERYGFWQNNFEKYQELADRGIYLQMNINSITGHYSAQTRKAAQWLIDKDLISFVGSDCHRMDHIELMKIALKDKHFQKLLNSTKLLNKTL
ncbi:MAG TPA: CpsB/CapC family capsule biosynthesis tyrosine phosphatase [Bacteroidia bacterium]|jgi:protein-tyrosine phosphatase|nr:CpsB/CapC family capsule biosynthesis tyrosine phosphatase [Bacteroidia bacterium]